jgi:thymidylate synthase
MNTLDTQYQDLLKSILEYGVNKDDRTGTGTKSIFGYTIRHNMKHGFPLLTTKKMAWKSIVTELLWFLRGDTNIKFLLDYDCHIWDGDAYKNYSKLLTDDFHGPRYTKEQFIQLIKTNSIFAKDYGNLGPIYGKQWRQWQGWMDMNGNQKGSLWYDQIQRLLTDLKRDPDSRRLMVNAWNVAELDQMVLPPCHYGFQVYTRLLTPHERLGILQKKGGGRLDGTPLKSGYEDQYKMFNVPSRTISLMFNMRSTDVGLGLGFNLASYGLLLSLLAKEVNMVPEDLIGNLGDAHLYLNHIEQVTEQLEREPYKLPTLNLNFEYTYWDGYLVEWDKIPMDQIIIENYQSHPPIKMPLSN